MTRKDIPMDSHLEMDYEDRYGYPDDESEFWDDDEEEDDAE